MTMRELRAAANWGCQGGLLSVAEMEALHAAVLNAERHPAREESDRPFKVLEVGHYHGLSTAVIHAALVARKSPWEFRTIDHHRGDKWVPAGDSRQYFERNLSTYFPGVVFDDRDSGLLNAADARAELVFYDGDHAAEQLRWTAMVHNSGCRTFILDDLDWPSGRACRTFLEGFGWKLTTPEPVRDTAGDKATEWTMTLGVFTR